MPDTFPLVESLPEDTPKSAVGFEVNDLVRVRLTGALAVIEHIGGETSEDDHSSSSSDDGDDDDDDDDHDDADDDYDWVEGGDDNRSPRETEAALPWQRSTLSDTAGQGHGLISTYEDEDDGPSAAADDHRPEDRVGDDLPPPPLDDPAGIPSRVLDALREEDEADFGDFDEGPEVPVGSALLTLVEDGEELVLPVEQLEVEDRTFVLGEIVLSGDQEAPAQQSGVVYAVSKALRVRRMEDADSAEAAESNSRTTANEEYIPAERLSFFSGLRIDCYVTLGDWLGIVEYVQEDVCVEFADGSLAVVSSNRDRLESDDPRVTPQVTPESEGFFFPGMRVKASQRVWREAMWVHGRYRHLRSGIVKSVKMSHVGVHWIAIRQTMNQGVPPPSPPEVVPFSDVTPLDAFRSLWWRAGDRAVLENDRDNSRERGSDDRWIESNESPRRGSVGEETLSREGRERPQSLQLNQGARASRSARRYNSRPNGRLLAAHRRAREHFSFGEEEGSRVGFTSDPSQIVQVVGSRTLVTVLWQDGTKSENMPAVSLRSNEHHGAFDFWPGMMVARSVDDLEAESRTAGDSRPRSEETGVIVRASQRERTAVVRWQRGGNPREFGPEEEISVYDLHERSDYDVQLGDTVLRVSDVEGFTQKECWVGEVIGKGIGTVEVRWLEGHISELTPDQLLVVGDDDGESASDVDSDFESDNLHAHLHHHHNHHDHQHEENMEMHRSSSDPAFRANWGPDEGDSDALSAAIEGPIERVLHNAPVSVRTWGFVLTRVMDVVRQAFDAVSNAYQPLIENRPLTNNDAANLAQEVSAQVVAAPITDLAGNAAQEEPGDSSEITARWNDVKNAIRDFIKDLVLNSRRVVSNSVNDSLPEAPETSNIRDANVSPDSEMTASVAEQESALGMVGDSDSNKDTSEQTKVDVNMTEEISDPLESFSRFEVVESLLSHHYAERSSSSDTVAPQTGFSGIVRKEWSRLQRHLPQGIFVHGCESRQDLLRAAIVGPSGTPYEYVLFFFDILLPPVYPSEPPRVYFWSHGRRLNPNLYEDGKVCLSILGTWDGDGVEQWDARNSNVLRVLLSLQAMVFVEEPYYNEAGYEKQNGTAEGRSNSRLYNESTLLLSLRHLVTSTRPGGTPDDFVDLASAHYRANKSKLLQHVRSLCEEGNASEQCSEDAEDERPYSSKGFRRSLAELIPRVSAALDNS